MTPATRAILTNREVIAVDQDPLGIAGRRVVKDGDSEVWARPLQDGGRAVVLLNRGSAPRKISVSWQALGYPADLSAQVRDLWTGKVAGKLKQSFSATVAPHAVVMVKIG
jgi:alpha-galactosidase